MNRTNRRGGPGSAALGRAMALPGVLLLALTAGCTPTVKVTTDEPITINLNVNIKHEIRVKVDQELDNLFENSDLF